MIRILKLLLLTVVASLSTSLLGQEALPYDRADILLFIEPFEDQGPDHSQKWLEQGFPRFIASNLGDEADLHVYQTPDFSSSLVDRPHKYQDLIWKSVFQRKVDPDYETYLVLGSYSYLEGKLTVRMDLLSLKNTQVLASFHERLDYTDLLSWKGRLGEWVLEHLRLGDDPSNRSSLGRPGMSEMSAPLPGVSLRDQLTSLFDDRQKKEEVDLQKKYEQQSRMKLGTQLESLWHDIAYEPYLARIHDIQTLRLQAEPDSVAIHFKVSYRINPRILDEIEHFSKTRAGLVDRTESFEGHAFMDLGYIDAAFTKAVAGGDWRLVPIITMGPKQQRNQRTFYHSFPMPIERPGETYYNRGEFKQLLMAIPGVNAMRIFVQERQQEYEYSIIVGYNEIKDLDKIQVSFVPEQDLSKHL